MGKKAYLKEAAVDLDLSIYQLRRFAKENKIPFLKSGNRYIFDIELVSKHLEKEAFENIKPIVMNSNRNGGLRKVNE